MQPGPLVSVYSIPRDILGEKDFFEGRRFKIFDAKSEIISKKHKLKRIQFIFADNLKAMGRKLSYQRDG